MLRILLSIVIVFLTVFVGLAAFDGAALADRGGTKGKSPSNPDGNGADKPVSEPAAFGGAASQGPDYYDGNNGCGQDRRYDVAPDHQGGYDDNNGHCGKPGFAGQQGFANRGRGHARAALQAAVKGAVSAPANVDFGAKAGVEAQAGVSAPTAVTPSAAVAGEVVAPPSAAVAGVVEAPSAEAPAAEQPAPEIAPETVPTMGGRLGGGDDWDSVLMTLTGLAMTAGAGWFLLKRAGPES